MARIRIGTQVGPPFPLETGVPQGSVLSPTLYVLYTSDCPASNAGINVLYADDVSQVVFHPGRSSAMLNARTSREIARVSTYEEEWKIQTNVNKFKPTPAPGGWCSGGLPGQRDRPRPQDLQLRIRLTRVNPSALATLYRFRDLDANLKLHLVKALVLPVLTYPPVPLHALSKNSISKLQRVQNAAIRFVVNHKWEDFVTMELLHGAVDLPAVNVRLHHLASQVWLRMQEEDWEQFRALQELSDAAPDRSHGWFPRSLRALQENPLPIPRVRALPLILQATGPMSNGREPCLAASSRPEPIRKLLPGRISFPRQAGYLHFLSDRPVAYEPIRALGFPTSSHKLDTPIRHIRPVTHVFCPLLATATQRSSHYRHYQTTSPLLRFLPAHTSSAHEWYPLRYTNISKLKDLTCAHEYAVAVSNRFNVIGALGDPIELWDTFKRETFQAAKEYIGERPRSRRGFVSTETPENIEESRAARLAGNQDQHKALSRRTRTHLGRDKERHVWEAASAARTSHCSFYGRRPCATRPPTSFSRGRAGKLPNLTSPASFAPRLE
ncbi:hypothetical protein GWK47_005185 [Chionoecetes opilio]|uniref:Reverse transcriptase domain-containing protein n=1 Tax=Chionoecetes opilio TaxID=41210 RepID=A0A8J4YAG4_CHIOP|nr:hypothetical protein GWK47_005185 [Chionoecetes opilio]